LRKLARNGEEAMARKRIDSIRALVAEEEANPEAAAERKATNTAAFKAAREAASAKASPKEERAKEFTNPRAANALAAKPLKAGYSLKGKVPEGFDGAAAEALVTERTAAKIARNFDKADELQVQIVAMGVRLDDRRRTWSVQN